MTSDAWAVRAVQLAVEVGASEIAVEAFAARATYTRLVTEVLARFRVDRPIRVTGWPPKGTDRGKGDAVARSTGLLAALETGRARVAGYLPDFEAQAVTWEAEQHQPDRVAAAVVAYDVPAHAVTEPMHIVTPLDAARRAREGACHRRTPTARIDSKTCPAGHGSYRRRLRSSGLKGEKSHACPPTPRPPRLARPGLESHRYAACCHRINGRG